MKIKVLEIHYKRTDRDAGEVAHVVNVVTRPATAEESAQQDTINKADSARVFLGAVQQVVGAAVHEWSKQNEISVDQEALEFAIVAYIERVNAKARTPEAADGQ